MTKFVIAISLMACWLSNAHAQRPYTISGKDVGPRKETSVRIQETLDQRLAELSQQITGKTEAGQKRTIAVLEFTDLRAMSQTSDGTWQKN